MIGVNIQYYVVNIIQCVNIMIFVSECCGGKGGVYVRGDLFSDFLDFLFEVRGECLEMWGSFLRAIIFHSFVPLSSTLSFLHH